MDEENSNRCYKHSSLCEKIEIIKIMESTFKLLHIFHSFCSVSLDEPPQYSHKCNWIQIYALYSSFSASPLVCSNKFSIEIINDTVCILYSCRRIPNSWCFNITLEKSKSNSNVFLDLLKIKYYFFVFLKFFATVMCENNNIYVKNAPINYKHRTS